MADVTDLRPALRDRRRAQLAMCRAIGPLIEDPLDEQALEQVCSLQAFFRSQLNSPVSPRSVATVRSSG